jgi:hypothetical protein
VVHACRQRHWHFSSVGKSNRRFIVGSLPHQLGRYGRNLLRRRVPCCAIQGLRKRRGCPGCRWNSACGRVTGNDSMRRPPSCQAAWLSR